MVSATQQTTRRRKIRAQSAGRKARAILKRQGTPAFPLHPAGYDAKAPDAKPAPAAQPAAAAPKGASNTGAGTKAKPKASTK